MNPKLPEKEKDEGSHRDLVELSGVHGDDLSEALDESRIDLNTEVALDVTHPRGRRAIRKLDPHPGTRRTPVVVSDQEASHPANGIPDGESRGTQIGHLPEWQAPTLDLEDHEKNRPRESTVPHHSAP